MLSDIWNGNTMVAKDAYSMDGAITRSYLLLIGRGVKR